MAATLWFSLFLRIVLLCTEEKQSCWQAALHLLQSMPRLRRSCPSSFCKGTSWVWGSCKAFGYLCMGLLRVACKFVLSRSAEHRNMDGSKYRKPCPKLNVACCLACAWRLSSFLMSHSARSLAPHGFRSGSQYTALPQAKCRGKQIPRSPEIMKHIACLRGAGACRMQSATTVQSWRWSGLAVGISPCGADAGRMQESGPCLGPWFCRL